MNDAPRWLDDDEMRAWLGYRRMRQLLDARIDKDLADEARLSGRDYDVMSQLGDDPDSRVRVGDLSAALRWSRSRLSHHLTRMETRGLVRREDDPEDGRGAWIALTDAGRASLVAAAPGHVASVRRHLIDLLTPEQVRVLGDIAEVVLPPLTR
ncbi:MarR family winged helix-turn-helix transcriptional regulator [Stackebrandtia soli]|uniref:MarR family winged helix-turn-helix transcriptional regulator n=1 Tax=Stackebrandtia soli TaxID=1892856 RepID=UPI0039ED6D5E